MQRFNLKDEQAYHKLFQQFYSYLGPFAERRVENHKVAEDIVQGNLYQHLEKTNNTILSTDLKLICTKPSRTVVQITGNTGQSKKKYTAHVLYEQNYPDFSVQEEEILRGCTQLSVNCRNVARGGHSFIFRR